VLLALGISENSLKDKKVPPTSSAAQNVWGSQGRIVMVSRYTDPFEALFSFQRALENRLSSDWQENGTAGRGSYPPINVFQRGDDLIAIIELPGVDKAN
jgi:HSP20 family protein